MVKVLDSYYNIISLFSLQWLKSFNFPNNVPKISSHHKVENKNLIVDDHRRNGSQLQAYLSTISRVRNPEVAIVVIT